MYRSPKIVFAKIARRAEAFYDETGEFASINTNCIHNFSEKYDPLYVLAWVNSRLFQYVYECLFDGLRMAGGFLPYSAPYLSNMCIKDAPGPEQQAIAKLAQKAIDQKTAGLGSESVDAQIDLAIYALFGLSGEEIAHIELAVSSEQEADAPDDAVEVE